MSIIKATNLSCGYGGKNVINDISFSAENGQLIGVLGPNGSGKTTLLRALCNFIPVEKGEILINGKNINSLNRGEIAKLVSFVPQISEPAEGFTVKDIVFMGRNPHIPFFSVAKEKDYEIVKLTLEEAGLSNISGKDISELSGGEYQRVIIARCMAQETPIIMLDEPTSHLDIRFQLEVLEMIRGMKNKTMIATFHDLTLAKKYCSRIILLKDGRIFADDSPEIALSDEAIYQVYGVNPHTISNTITNGETSVVRNGVGVK